MKVVVVVALVLAGLVVLDQLALAAERRGWIYWRKRTASRSTAGNALQGFHAIFEPDRAHTVEEQRRIKTEEAGDADPLG